MNQESNHVVKVRINLAYLARLMKLPPHIKLTKVRQDWIMERSGSFEVLVESPELKEVPEYSKIPDAEIWQHYDFCREDEVSHLVKGEVKAL